MNDRPAIPFEEMLASLPENDRVELEATYREGLVR